MLRIRFIRSYSPAFNYVSPLFCLLVKFNPTHLKALQYPMAYPMIYFLELLSQLIGLSSVRTANKTLFLHFKWMLTLNPIVSNITIISLSLGPICLPGNSSLGGKSGPSGLIEALKYLLNFRHVRGLKTNRFITINLTLEDNKV